MSKAEDHNAIKINLLTELESVSAVRHAQLIEIALNIADDDAHIVEGKVVLRSLKMKEVLVISDLLLTKKIKCCVSSSILN